MTARHQLASSWRGTRSAAARVLRRASELAAPQRSAWDLRARIGGGWERLGRLQFDFMVEHGLQPPDRMLDVGCGVLRGGRHYIAYLEPGNYHGIDIDPGILEGARQEVVRSGLTDRTPTLRLTDEFDVDFGVAFDVALAQSVFTHVPMNAVWRCLTNVAAVLRPGGRFFASFFAGPEGPERWEPIDHAHDGRLSFGDRNPYHYAMGDFRWMCADLPLHVEDLGEWGHPRRIHMACFTHAGERTDRG